MTFTISLAGISIEIHSLYNDVYELCRDYWTGQNPDFCVAVTQADIDFEREKSASEAKHEGRPVVDFSNGYLETLAVYRKIAEKMLEYNAFLMHGAVVALDGKAYLFTAPSGLGKTTHTRFWLQKYPNAFILNGDKPFLRMIGNQIFACGTPWAGKEGQNQNAMLPLYAVCALFRGKENRIERISFEKVFPLVIGQTYRPGDVAKMKKTMELIGAMGKRTRFYTMACNLDPEAARVAKEGMNQDESN